MPQRRNAEAPLYYFNDHLGSTRAAAGTDGAAAGSTDFPIKCVGLCAPYGEKYPTVAGEAEVEGKTRGAGQRCGELIGLYDYLESWYDPYFQA